MKEIKIPGTTANVKADDKPSIAAYGEDGTGKTRFACSMPLPIGYLAVDRKAKRTLEKVMAELNMPTHSVIVNDKPLITEAEMRQVAMYGEKEYDKIKEVYKPIIDRAFDLAYAYSSHPDIQSICTDRLSQLFDWVLFAFHGRTSKIDPLTGRGDLNNWIIDYINLCKSKNALFINGAGPMYKDEIDAKGNKKSVQVPGKWKPEGFSKIGSYVLANVEFRNKQLSATERTVSEEAQLDSKFRIVVQRCQERPLIEGMDLAEFGVKGKEITWDNLMMVLGIE